MPRMVDRVRLTAQNIHALTQMWRKKSINSIHNCLTNVTLKAVEKKNTLFSSRHQNNTEQIYSCPFDCIRKVSTDTHIEYETAYECKKKTSAHKKSDQKEHPNICHEQTHLNTDCRNFGFYWNELQLEEIEKCRRCNTHTRTRSQTLFLACTLLNESDVRDCGKVNNLCIAHPNAYISRHTHTHAPYTLSVHGSQ